MDIFKENREFFYQVAQENTKKNEFGQTTISRDDESIFDDCWDLAYALQQVKSFITSDKALEGFILVLYGLRPTIMEQTLSACPENKCAFYEVQDMDSLSDVHKAIIEAKEKGVEIICLDEITRANDFITNFSMLPDVFAKEGIRIIVTGTDSLCFQFASSNELFDRTVRIQTVTDTPICRQAATLCCRYLATERVTTFRHFLEGNFHCLR